MSPSVWQAAIDRVVGDLLESSGIATSPVDAIRLAAALSVTVAIVRDQPERGRIKRLAGSPSIFLRPEDRPERLQWAAAHELGEAVAFRICQEAGVAADDLPPGGREELANEFAGRLLVPQRWIERACRNEIDLQQLKLQFKTASHELIAFRLLALSTAAVVTMCDQGRVSRRLGNRHFAPPPLLPVELECLFAMRQTREPCRFTVDGVAVQGWPVYEGDWRREFLRTTSLEESAD